MTTSFAVDYLNVKLALSGGNGLSNAREDFYNRPFNIHSSSNWRGTSFIGILLQCITMVMTITRKVVWTLQTNISD
jgi:hypothetical protein